MASGTVPSQVTQGSALKIGFQRSDGHWVVDTFANGTHTPSETTGLIRGGTSPDLALNGPCVFSFAFQGTDGRMHVGTNGQASGGKPTNAFLAGGTSPSVAMNS